MKTWSDVSEYIASDGMRKLAQNFRQQRKLEDFMSEKGIPLPPKPAILQEVEDILLGPRKV